MTNFKIIMDNLADKATLSVETGTFETILPLANLQKYNNSRVARTTTPEAIVFSGVWTEPQKINGFAIHGHTFSDTAIISVIIWKDDDLSGDIVFQTEGETFIHPRKALDELDWGIDPLNVVQEIGVTGDNNFVLWFDDVVAQSFLVTIYDEDNLESYADMNRLYIGSALSAERNASYGLKNSLVDNSIQVRTAGKGLHTYSVDQFRKLSFGVDEMTTHERADFFKYFGKCGKTKDVYVSIFPTMYADLVGGQQTQIERDYSFAGKFVNYPEIGLDHYNSFSQQFEIEEC